MTSINDVGIVEEYGIQKVGQPALDALEGRYWLNGADPKLNANPYQDLSSWNFVRR